MKKRLLFYLFFVLCSTYVSAQTYELDNSYVTGTGFNAEVNTSAIDANGEVLFGGDFTSYNGTTRNYLARLNADGTVDTSFDPATTLTSSVYDIAIHADGSITTAGGNGLKRFDDTGTVFGGGTFTAASANNVVNVVAAEATGFAIIIGGDFTDIGGKIARLIADGSVDATFATNIGAGFNGSVRTIEITSTGKILVGGDFTTFNGVTRSKIALLNSDGTLDTGFVPASLITSSVYAIAMQADGKVLAGKPGTSSTLLFRFNTDGSEDISFNNGLIPGLPSFIRDIHTNGTDNIIVTGWFDQGVVMLDYSNGTVIDIATGNGIEGATKEINTMAVQADGGVIIGGDFTSYNGLSITNAARIATCAVSIDTQPSYTSTCETNDASFTVAASGTGTLSYQWQENTTLGTGIYADITDGGIYAGATTSTLDLIGVTSDMAGYYYRCIVTDDNCSSTTGAVMLGVNTIQVITSDPVDDVVCDGGSASFTVTYTGTYGGFQWQEDPGTGVFADMTGATNNTLSLPGVTTAMTGYKYRLVSTLCNPSTTTASATLTVNELPVVTQQAVVQAICVSGDAIYTVEASVVSGTLTYQWQYRITNTSTYADLSDAGVYSGTSTDTLVVTGADNTTILNELYDTDFSDGKTFALYRCVITANGCSVNSGLTYLNIHDAPTVTADPIDVTKCDTGNGASASFSVTSSIVVGGLIYQWQVDDGTGYVNVVDDAVYSGSTAKDLLLTGATSALSGNTYKCIIGNCATPVESLGALLTIDDQPILTVGPVLTNTCEGSDVEFSVTVTGTNLSYQWEVAPAGSSTFTAITNDLTYFATGGILQISGATIGLHNYRYRCVITSGSCSLNTGSGTLRVYTQPTLTNSSATSALTVCEGGSTILRVTRSSTLVTGVHSYQWQSDNGIGVFTDITDGTNYANTNTSQLGINNPPLSFSGMQYRCVVRGCITENASTPETLIVNQLPLVTTFPISQTLCVGEVTTFTAEATGTGVTYKWYYSSDGGVDFSSYAALSGMSGYNTSTLSIYAYLSYNGYLFKCVASAAIPCNVTDESPAATLTVNETTITTQPVSSVTICQGENTNYTIVASGNSLTYQWYDNGGTITDGGIYSGATTASLTLTGATSALNGSTYYCVVNGSCTAATSYNSYLYVYGVDKPIITADFYTPAQPYLYVNNVSGESFEWFLNGSSYSNEYGQIYISEAGSYTVIVSYNGCPSEESDAQVIIVTDVDKDVLNKIQAYPNPVTDNLIIRLAKINENTEIRVLGLDGRVKISQHASEFENTVNMAHLSKGAYLVQIINAEKTLTYKVIKE